MRIAQPVSLFAALLALVSCTLNKTEDSKKDRSMSLLNERRYEESIEELEQALRDNPKDRSNALLLAMAHIGRANAELFQLLGAVLAHQSVPPPSLLAAVRCGDEPWDNLQNKSVACLATRILRQVPEEPNLNMARAQALIRDYYRDYRGTSSDINFLAAYIELYRILNRTRVLTSKKFGAEITKVRITHKKFEDVTTPEFEKADALFAFTVRELKAMGEEFMHFFRRMKYSYSKLATYTKSIDGKPMLEYKRHRLIFDDEMTVSRIFKFMVNAMEDEKGDTDRNLNRKLSGFLEKWAPEIVKIARRLRYVSGPEEALDRITTSIQFESFIRDFLTRLGNSARGPASDIPFFLRDDFDRAADVFWETPPGIFGDLSSALRQSWDSESLRAMAEYHRKSAPDWTELADVLALWKKVSEDSSGTYAGHKMRDSIFERRRLDASYLRFPDKISPESVHGWLREVVTEAGRYEQDYLSGKYSANGELPLPARRALVHEAWTRTKAWCEKNLLL